MPWASWAGSSLSENSRTSAISIGFIGSRVGSLTFA